MNTLLDNLQLTPEYSRALGTTLGLVVGDALGTTLEFAPRDVYAPVTHMVGAGPFNLPRGGWTDDTSMALALGDALLEKGAFDPHVTQQRFLSWYRNGAFSHNGRCFDIGGTTAAALRRYEQDPTNPYQGSTAPHTAANGGIMRLAPVFTFYADDRTTGTQVAIDQSRLTHAHPLCLEYAQRCADVVYDAFEGKRHPDLDAFKHRPRAQVKSGGFVKDTYEAACWAIGTTTTFKDALIKAVNLAGDADTVGAVTGMLAGALYGIEEIPSEWLSEILWSLEIHHFTRLLYARRTASVN